MPPCHSNHPPVDLTRPSATSILSAEHRVILQVLACVELMAQQAQASGAIPTAHAHQALEVLRTFADHCHHGKEEEILFPALEAKSPGFHPTSVMRQEHVTGREYIAGMTDSLPRNDARQFALQAFAYVELLRSHIFKEDKILFPMAQSMLSAKDDAAILDAYRAIEHDDLGDGTHERMLGIADALAATYGIPRASANAQIFALLTAICGCADQQRALS